jgi:hypothetical protein
MFSPARSAVDIEHYCFDKTTGEVDIAYSKDDTSCVKEMYFHSETSNLSASSVISKNTDRIHLEQIF